MSTNYILSVVPTEYEFASGEKVITHQYSYTMHQGNGFPGMCLREGVKACRESMLADFQRVYLNVYEP